MLELRRNVGQRHEHERHRIKSGTRESTRGVDSPAVYQQIEIDPADTRVIAGSADSGLYGSELPAQRISVRVRRDFRDHVQILGGWETRGRRAIDRRAHDATKTLLERRDRRGQG